MSKIKNQKSEKPEIMETLTVEPTIENANEVLAETQENANGEQLPKSEENANGDGADVSETLTPEILTAKIKDAKKVLAELNDEFDYDETNEQILAKEKEISDLLTERKNLVKEIEKLELLNQFNAKLKLAKDDLCDKLGIANDLLETLIANAKDVKDTLIVSFNTVFGKPPVFVSENTNSKNLAKSNAKSSGGVNITKSVKEMLTAGDTPENIVNFILANSEMDETKAKKRLNDIKWGWEIENGLREKPKK